MTSHIIPNELALEFMTAGNSTVTLKDLRGNDTRYTYKLQASDDNKFLWIKVLNGSDNVNNYIDIYCFNAETGLRFLRKSHRIHEDSPSVKFFKTVFTGLLYEKEMQWLEVWHTGRCCRCGRTLTVPESIAAGIGPECITKQNQFHY